MLMETFLSYNLILPKYLRFVKEKGSLNPKMRPWEGGIRPAMRRDAPSDDWGEPSSGEGGIRTHGNLAITYALQAYSFGRSDTSPITLPDIF